MLGGLALILSACGLQLGPPAFGEGRFACELRAAHRAAAPAVERLLQLHPSPTAHQLEALQRELGASLSASGSHREGGRWLTHVDQQCVTVSLLGPEGAQLGLAWSPAQSCTAAGEAELLYATVNGGAYVQRGSGAPEKARLGGASMRANVVHLPDAPSGEVDLMANMLRDTGATRKKKGFGPHAGALRRRRRGLSWPGWVWLPAVHAGWAGVGTGLYTRRGLAAAHL
jgi:hypothetical protein